MRVLEKLANVEGFPADRRPSSPPVRAELLANCHKTGMITQGSCFRRFELSELPMANKPPVEGTDDGASPTLAWEQGAKTPIASHETHSHRHSDTDPGHLEVRCPSCHVPMEVEVDTTLTDLTCSACGSHFSLVDQAQETRLAPALTKMGRFELIERLGVGGFGSVWKARDKELDRTVAVKVPRHGALTAESQEKFFREARAAAQLRHPRIVSVYEVGRDGDSIYIVSAMVRGVTLGDWLTGQRLTIREAAELCAKMAEALHHAHEHGVVHRDLKPANIMIDEEGEPNLMDFGLARRDVGEVTVTVEGQVMGTPAYMSPEQAQGEAHQADRRSDIYSLGVILFQLLTGELPFRGNARMILHQVIHDDPPSPRKFNVNVPKDLETVTLKCLEKSPDRRYLTALALAEELRRFQTGKSINARPIGRVEQGLRWVKRNKSISALTSAVVLSLLAGTIISTYFAIQARQQARLAQAREKEARQSDSRAREATEQKNAAAHQIHTEHYAASLRRVSQAWDRGNVRRMIEILASQVPQDGESDVRGFEWSYWLRKCRLYQTSLVLRDDSAVSCVKYSPDNKWLATGQSNGTVRLFDVQTDEFVRRITIGDKAVRRLDFFPDASKLLTVDEGGRASVWDVVNELESPLFEIATGQNDITHAVVAPDGSTICTASAKGVVATWSVESQERQVLMESDDSKEDFEVSLVSLAYSPDGDMIAAGDEYSDFVTLWNSKTGKQLFRLNSGPDHTGGLAFDPTGPHVATSAYQRIYIFDTKTGRRRFVHFCHPNEPVNSIDWRSDDVIATGGSDDVIELLDAATGETVSALKGHQGIADSIDFSPDGGHLASAGTSDFSVQWTIPRETSRDRVALHSNAVYAARFAPHATSVASAGREGDILLWDARKPEVRDNVGVHTGGVRELSFFPDQPLLASGGWDGKVKIWNIHAKSLHKEFPSYSGGARIAISPDGKLFALQATAVSIRILHGQSFQEVTSFNGHTGTISGICFSPDSKYIVSIANDGTGRGEVFLWDILTGLVSGSYSVNDNEIKCVRYSPDGRLCALGLAEGTLLILDGRTAEVIRELQGSYANTIWSIAFSPDGRRLLSAGEEISLWDVATGQEMGRLQQFSSSAYDIAFDDTGDLAVAALGDGGIAVLDADISATSPVSGELALTSAPKSLYPADVIVDLNHRKAEVLARSLINQERLKDAEVIFRDQLASEREQLVDDHPMVLNTLSSLADVQSRLGKWDDAAANYVRAIDKLEDHPGFYSPKKTASRRVAENDQLFDRVLKLRPNERTLWIGRGHYHVLCSQWEQACDDFGKVIDLLPPTFDEVCEYGYLLLILNRQQEYEQFCAELLKRAGDPKDALAAFCMARLFSAGEQDVVDADDLIDWATQGAANGGGWTWDALSLAQYRAGEFNAAIETAKKAHDIWIDPDRTGTWLVQAMAQHRLGNAAAAQQCIETARQLINQARLSSSDGTPKRADGSECPPPDWAEMNALLGEAERVVQSSNQPATTPSN